MDDNLPVGGASDDQQNQQPQDDLAGVSSGGKERVDAVVSGAKVEGEKSPITEYTRKVDIEPEVEGWLEKMEKQDTQAPQAVIDDQTSQATGDDISQNNNFKVVLPMTKDQVEKGIHHKVIDSVRWLAEWCLRMIKIFGNKVAYRKG